MLYPAASELPVHLGSRAAINHDGVDLLVPMGTWRPPTGRHGLPTPVHVTTAILYRCPGVSPAVSTQFPPDAVDTRKAVERLIGTGRDDPVPRTCGNM